MAEDKFGYDPDKLNLKDFNDHSKGAVFYRNLQTDVVAEPLLVRADTNPDGSKSYLVHEDRGRLASFVDFIKGNPDNEGDLKRYNTAELDEKFGGIENMRTLEQYKQDYNILKETSGLGRELASNKDLMGFRIEEIGKDLAQAGETPVPKANINAQALDFSK